MNENARQPYQFNVNVFNRSIIVSMNLDFLCELGNVLDDESKQFPELVEAIDTFWNGYENGNEPEYIKKNDFTIVRFGNMYQMFSSSEFAKSLSAKIGETLHNLRMSNENTELPVSVIFAFVKKLEMAAFNHYRDLNERAFIKNYRRDLEVRGVARPNFDNGYNFAPQNQRMYRN